MQDREQLEALFLANLSLIDRIIGAIANRHDLRGDDAAELSSWIRLRLVESDYAVFRKFRGESSIGTYLTVAITMMFRDYRVQQRGRWRPSAAARRRGPLAMRLESLLNRRRHTLREAAEVLRSEGATALSERELASIARELPERLPLRPVKVSEDNALGHATADRADEAIESENEERERRESKRALDEALLRLSSEDQIILRLRFWEGSSIADIARALSLAQKPLYRRLERALADLRKTLEEQGMSRERLRSLLEGIEP